jgi:hypothetical protein
MLEARPGHAGQGVAKALEPSRSRQMPAPLPAGPLRSIKTREGFDAPFYVIPFDERGLCTGPATRTDLLASAADPVRDFSDIVLFSHGWNNDWSVALDRYDNFLGGFAAMRRSRDLAPPDPWRPLLVGIFWPSTAWVFGEEERGPEIAAGGGGDEHAAAQAAEQAELTALAAGLDEADARKLYALAQSASLDAAAAGELAELVAPMLAADDELGGDAAPSAAELAAIWRTSATLDGAGGRVGGSSGNGDGSAGGGGAAGLEEFGTVGGGASLGAGGAGEGGPEAAGLLDLVDPRKVLRLLTVWRMKDRAGLVGRHGVGPLLRELLLTSSARVHLVGHSFGAKVMLSALADESPQRPVRSMLLLQPAVSHLCFAPAGRVPRTDRAGGYHAVPGRVELPVATTFSRHDKALHDLFHLMLRRERDLGEAEIAAPDEPPSRFAALGGYGPREAGQQLRTLPAVGEDLDLPANLPLLGLDGDVLDADGRPRISGHGDISHSATWWTMYKLLRA